jgi:23S rRNA (adenine2503-C2)-methyltransferase
MRPQVPSSWRQELVRQGVTTGRSKLFKEVRAADGTRKFLLQLHDGYLVETVGIPLDDADKHRLTVCVSSQACRFSWHHSQ